MPNREKNKSEHPAALDKEVERRRAREAEREKERHRSVLKHLSYLGSLGWFTASALTNAAYVAAVAQVA